MPAGCHRAAPRRCSTRVTDSRRRRPAGPAPSFGREHRRPRDLGPQCLQRLLDDAPSQRLLVVGGQLRIAERVDDAGRGDDAVGADHHGYRRHGRDLHGRQSRALQLPGDRCAAASARPSGRREDDGINAGGAQLLGDLPPHARALGEGGGDADGGIDRLVELADGAAPLEITCDGDRRCGSCFTQDVSYPRCTLSYCEASRLDVPRMLSAPYRVAFNASMPSGFPRGTRPPSVTSAIVAPSSILTGGGAGTLGKAGRGTSVANGRPASLSSSMAVARSAGLAPATTLRVTPRAK